MCTINAVIVSETVSLIVDIACIVFVNSPLKGLLSTDSDQCSKQYTDHIRLMCLRLFMK